jgi:hypothetical protein
VDNKTPCHVLDGAIFEYTYAELGTVVVEFYDGLVKFQWIAGALQGEAGEGFAYLAKQISASHYLANWHEPEARAFVTLFIDLQENRVHSSVLAAYTTEDEQVWLHEAVLKRQAGTWKGAL